MARTGSSAVVVIVRELHLEEVVNAGILFPAIRPTGREMPMRSVV